MMKKRKLISVGDTITFTNIDSLEDIKVSVLDLHIYDSFEELYKHFDKAL